MRGSVAALPTLERLTKVQYLGDDSGVDLSGARDSTTGIQRQINKASGTNSALILPPGCRPKISDSLQMRENTQIIGFSKSAITNNGSSRAAADGCTIDATAIGTGQTALLGPGNSFNIRLQNFAVIGKFGDGRDTLGGTPTSEFGGIVGINPGLSASNFLIDNVYVAGFSNGIVCDTAVGGTLKDVYVWNSGTHCIALRNCQWINMWQCSESDCAGVSSQANRASNLYIYGSTGIRCYSSMTDEALTQPSVYIYSGSDISISNMLVYAQINGYGIRIGSAASRVRLHDIRVAPFTGDRVPINTILIDPGAHDVSLIDVSTNPNGGGDIADYGVNTVKINVNGTTTLPSGFTQTSKATLATGASHTVDDVITALQNLGLVQQSATAFDPLSLGPVAYYDAARSSRYQDSGRTTAANTDGDPVGSWSDLSGLGRHLSQSTSGNRPAYKTSIQNSLAVIRFTAASSQYMQLASLVLGQPFTIFVVGKVTSNASQQSFVGQNIDLNANTTKFGIYGGANVNGATADTSFHVHCGQFNNADSNSAVSFIRTDGVQSAGGNIGQNTMSQLNVGTYDTATQFLGGDLGTILVYNYLLSATEITSVEAYLKTRWGTP